MEQERFPLIKLLTIQPVTNTIAFLYDRFTEAGYYWFPPHVAIYAVKESTNARQVFNYVYLDNRPACYSEIVTGFCKEDPSLPIVRLSAQKPNSDVVATTVVRKEEFRALLKFVQMNHNGADDVPEIEIQKCCAETINEDIAFLKEELKLHGIAISNDVEDFCKEEITKSKEFLDMWNRPE